MLGLACVRSLTSRSPLMRKPLRVPHLGLTAGEVPLAASERHYVGRVHRLSAGSELLLFDPEAGTEARATLLDAKSGLCRVEAPRPAALLGFRGLTLFLARPKSAALERVVRDGVALGVGRVVFLDSEYSVVRAEGNPRRLREIALDEARQCERGDVPVLLGPMAFAQALDEAFASHAPAGRHLLLEPREAEQSLLDALCPLPPLRSPGALGLWVGPEGGFSDGERAALRAKGAVAVHLGPLVLRVASAVGAALATVLAVAHSRAHGSNWAEPEAAR